jgi:NAD(P)-dependent dehydrogenase (short-subunit alcohol dehydrogenase family)
MIDFTGKNVLVTGASRGIGRSIAQQFAQQGARVAVHYRQSRDRAEQTIASLSGGSHILVQADVRDAEAVSQMVETAVGELGRLDILVNNAGLYEEHPLAVVSYAEWQASWRRVLETNLIGAANVTYCVAQHMIERGDGRIVNVSSRGAFRGEPDGPAYGASKAGLNAMGQSLAR